MRSTTSSAASGRRSRRVDQPRPAVLLGPNARGSAEVSKDRSYVQPGLLYSPPAPHTSRHSHRDKQRSANHSRHIHRPIPKISKHKYQTPTSVCFQIELSAFAIATQLVKIRRGYASSESVSVEVIYRLSLIQYKLRKMVKAHSQRMAGVMAAAMVLLLVFAAHADAARPAPAPFAGDGPTYAPAYSPESSPVGSPAYAPSSGPSSSETPASAPGPVSGATIFD